MADVNNRRLLHCKISSSVLQETKVNIAELVITKTFYIYRKLPIKEERYNHEFLGD